MRAKKSKPHIRRERGFGLWGMPLWSCRGGKSTFVGLGKTVQDAWNDWKCQQFAGAFAAAFDLGPPRTLA